MINIGLVGFGTVGTGTVKILQSNIARIEERAGDKIRIKKICDKSSNEIKSVVKIANEIKSAKNRK